MVCRRSLAVVVVPFPPRAKEGRASWRVGRRAGGPAGGQGGRWSDTDRRASELALVRGERCTCVRPSPHPHRAMTADSPVVPATTPPAWVPCGAKHKQDRPGGSWGVKNHHITHHQLPLNPYCRVCARLGMVFVEFFFSPARAVNPQTRNATAVDQVHCRVSYVDSQQIGSVVRPRQ